MNMYKKTKNKKKAAKSMSKWSTFIHIKWIAEKIPFVENDLAIGITKNKKGSN